MRIKCYPHSENTSWTIDTKREFKKVERSAYPHDYKTYIKETLDDLENRIKEKIIHKYEIYSI